MTSLFAFGCGLLFAVGLAVSGMTNPAKVVGFLDVTGAWDPTLAFVMGGALSVYAVAWRLRRRQAAPLLAPGFHQLPRLGIDRRLLLGAAVFGLGWGVSGYCPGPAITSVGVTAHAPLFVAAMLGGMFAMQQLDRLLPAADSC